MKTPIVILHGWRLSGERYLELKKMLQKKGFAVFAPDLPGFGKSVLPSQPLTLSDYVDFVYKYCQKNKLKKIILIGHSFGGRVSIKFSAKYPYLIEELILTGVPGLIPVNSAKIGFFLILSKLGKIFFSLPVISSFEEIGRKILYRAARATDYMHTNGAMRETFKSIIREDLKNAMRRIKAPTLLVWGESDTIVPVAIAQKMEKIIPRVKLKIIPEETHGLPYENARIFLQAILSKYV